MNYALDDQNSPKIQINPSKALYIKLGFSGSWEKESLERGILRFGYQETPFNAAVTGDWDTVHKFWMDIRKDQGAATRDVNQIRYYFESDEDILWITFHEGKLWWCFAKPGVKQHQDGDGSYRETSDGWHDTDVNLEKLSTDKLSGSLIKVHVAPISAA
jgi:hypothetical protein